VVTVSSFFFYKTTALGGRVAGLLQRATFSCPGSPGYSEASAATMTPGQSQKKKTPGQNSATHWPAVC
jgi:hypothetical protein